MNTTTERTLKDYLTAPRILSRLADVSKGFMEPRALARMALVASMKTPDILACSQESVLAALMDAADLKIRPGGMMGRGYLIPRRNNKTGQLECCLDPGYRGLIDIMCRNPNVACVEARPVFEKDDFHVREGTGGYCYNHPWLGGNRGAVIAAFAKVTFRNGVELFEVMSRDDLENIQAMSMAKTGPWLTWADEMSRKSAVRRLAKYIPNSDETLERAAYLAAATEPAGKDMELEQRDTGLEEEEPQKPSRAMQLATAIKKSNGNGDGPPPGFDEPEPYPEGGAR